MAFSFNPYLNFKDNARQAMEFYKSVFGGELTVSTFGDMPMPGQDPSENNLVMHSELKAPNVHFMASDTPSHMEYKPQAGFGLSLSGEDEAELRALWDQLAEGGTVTMPLEKAPWGDVFGMLTDKFGVSWMVNVNQPGGQGASSDSDEETAEEDEPAAA